MPIAENNGGHKLTKYDKIWQKVAEKEEGFFCNFSDIIVLDLFEFFYIGNERYTGYLSFKFSNI
jgi:hypothetical protein